MLADVQLTHNASATCPTSADVQDPSYSPCLQCLIRNSQALLGTPHFSNLHVLLDVLDTGGPRSVLALTLLQRYLFNSDKPTEQDVFGFGKQDQLPPSSLTDEAVGFIFETVCPRGLCSKVLVYKH